MIPFILLTATLIFPGKRSQNILGTIIKRHPSHITPPPVITETTKYNSDITNVDTSSERGVSPLCLPEASELLSAPPAVSSHLHSCTESFPVFISDTHFWRIKGLTRIHHPSVHHPWHRTSPIFPAFELVGPESFIVYSPGGLSHFPSQYRIYHILFYLHSHINDIYVPKVRL